MPRLLPLCILSLLLAALCSCTNSPEPHYVLPHSPEQAQSAGQAGLPGGITLAAPSTLQQSPAAEPRSGSFVPADLLREAEAFEPALPQQRVSATAAGAAFTPDFAGAAPSAAGLSYACYVFEIPDYSGNALVQTGWISPPQEPSEYFVGLANWDRDRWDFYRLNGAGNAVPPSMDPYLDFSGSLLAVLLASGEGAAELDFLRIGSNPPEVSVSALPEHGFVPFSVSFEALATDSDGEIVEYRWDPQGDGSYEISTGSTPQLEYEYSESGVFNAAVRAIDDDGIFGEAGSEVRAIGEINFSLGGEAGDEKACSIMQLPDGDLLVFGEQLILNEARRLLLIRFSPVGEVVFARGCEVSGNEFAGQAQLAADGYVYLCASSNGGSIDGLVQKWSTDGVLVWSKILRNIGTEWLHTLSVVAGQVFICGSHTPFGENGFRTLAVSMDSNGGLLWSRSIGSAGRDYYFTDVSGFLPSSFGAASVHFCGIFEPPNGNLDAFYVTYDTAGNLGVTDYWGTFEEYEYATDLQVSGVNNPVVTLCGYELLSGRGFISRHGGSSLMLHAGSGALIPAGMQGFAGGPCLLFSHSNDGGVLNKGYLARFDSSLTLLSVTEISSSSSFSPAYSPQSISSYGSVGLLLGASLAGALPQTASSELITEANLLPWFDTGSADAALELFIDDAPATLSDVEDLEFNRGAEDEDLHLLLLAE